MKKISKYFLLLLMVVSIGGCASKKVVNDFNGAYVEVESINDLTYNVEESIKNLNAFSFETIINIEGNSHIVKGDVILNNSFTDSVIKLMYNDINMYIKNETVYISYPYNNTNIIVKDSLKSFAKEISDSLENCGLSVSDEDIYSFIKTIYLKDLDISFLQGYTFNDEGPSYFVGNETINISFNENYLPSSIRCNYGLFMLDANFKYEPISIEVPVGYNLFTLNIEKVKDRLHIETFSELLK